MFGAKDAKRKLKEKLGLPKQGKLVAHRKKSKKIHNPSGVIFSAKNNIEKYKGKRVKEKIK